MQQGILCSTIQTGSWGHAPAVGWGRSPSRAKRPKADVKWLPRPTSGILSASYLQRGNPMPWLPLLWAPWLTDGTRRGSKRWRGQAFWLERVWTWSWLLFPCYFWKEGSWEMRSITASFRASGVLFYLWMEEDLSPGIEADSATTWSTEYHGRTLCGLSGPGLRKLAASTLSLLELSLWEPSSSA